MEYIIRKLESDETKIAYSTCSGTSGWHVYRASGKEIRKSQMIKTNSG